jgi:glycosyltransferase 2 family protein
VKSKLGQVIQFVIFFGLGAGLMWWQYSRFTTEQREEFHTGLREADYFWFFVAVFIGMLAHLMRAIRWQMLLTPLNRKAGLGSRFYAVMIGYLANYAFPRLGEVTRAGVLKTSDDIPFAESFGTIVVERIVDLLCLAVIFFIVLIVQFAELQALWLKYLWNPASAKIAGMMENPALFYGVICAIALFVAVLVMLRKRISGKLSGKAKAFFVGLKEGMLSIKKVPNPFLFVVQSLLIWTGYYLSLYTCFYCFDDTSSLTLHTALILLLFGTFGVAFTPGGIGAYQIIITEIMIAIAPATIAAAAPFSWLSWGAQVATVIIFTGIAFAARPALNKLRP